MISRESIFVEWLSDGAGKGSFQKLLEGMKEIGILNDEEARYKAIRDLSDCSILDLGEDGGWRVQPTRLAIIKQEAEGVRSVVCGSRDSRVNLALSKLPATSRVEPLGQFGLIIYGSQDDLLRWAGEHDLHVDAHWVAVQIKNSEEQLGFNNVKRAAEAQAKLPTPFFNEGSAQIRRLSSNFKRETITALPRAEQGAVLEIVEKYTNRRFRYVGTSQGWLKVPYVWAPWICAATGGKPLTVIRGRSSMSTPLWARLPEGLSRAVTLASGTPWKQLDGKLVSGPVPPALAYNLKRMLSLG